MTGFLLGFWLYLDGNRDSREHLRTTIISIYGLDLHVFLTGAHGTYLTKWYCLKSKCSSYLLLCNRSKCGLKILSQCLKQRIECNLLVEVGGRDSKAQRGVKHLIARDCQWEIGTSPSFATDEYRTMTLYVLCFLNILLLIIIGLLKLMAGSNPWKLYLGRKHFLLFHTSKRAFEITKGANGKLPCQGLFLQI